MEKIRVLFPFVEAGFGHIMPMKSIVETFGKKYGDKVDVVTSDFYKESGNKHLIKYEQMISRQVRMYNKNTVLGHFANCVGQFFGATLSSLGAVRLGSPIAYREGVKHLRELDVDAVFSTHWATNYYAEHIKENKPFTVMYCPDAKHNALFEYRSDLNMISMPYGYLKALRKRKYNIHNLKYVPFLIRNEVFEITAGKKELRRELGLPEDNFTVLLAEGGYGIGKTKKIVETLAPLDVPVTVIPVCGKNEKLYAHLKSLPHSEKVSIVPYKFTDQILKLHAASDIFCGKSGNIIAEATFFGNPSIVTNCSNLIEHDIADHYINTVGCSMKQLCPKKTVRMLTEFAKDPALLEPYRRAALDYHDNFGSEKAADELWNALVRRFPSLAAEAANTEDKAG